MTVGRIAAVILCGGRSSRLGGVPKAGLEVEGQTLLARTVGAARHALCTLGGAGIQRGETAQGGIVVVGPVQSAARWLGEAARDVVLVQEDPAFGGPAAGIAAGLAGLEAGCEGDFAYVLVLACDMIGAAALAEALVVALDNCDPDVGVMTEDDGRKQPLAGIYSLVALQKAVDAARSAGMLVNASVFSLLANVKTKECIVPAGLSADIDTWDDARRHGIPAPQ